MKHFLIGIDVLFLMFIQATRRFMDLFNSFMIVMDGGFADAC